MTTLDVIPQTLQYSYASYADARTWHPVWRIVAYGGVNWRKPMSSPEPKLALICLHILHPKLTVKHLHDQLMLLEVEKPRARCDCE